MAQEHSDINGAAIGGRWQTALYAAAIVVDWGGVYLTSRRGSRRIHSATYFTERHQLFVIIAIGESLIAMAAGATDHPIGVSLHWRRALVPWLPYSSARSSGSCPYVALQAAGNHWPGPGPCGMLQA
jgi:hypothetical protein